MDNKNSKSDKIGVYCSTALFIMVVVLGILALSGLNGDTSSVAVSVIILFTAPSLLVPACFFCWIILYLNNCRLRYHCSWIAVLTACFALVVILSLC